MYKYFLAKTIRGKEYIFNKNTAMFVCEKRKLEFLELLNKKRYLLNNDDEKWHLYENDYYMDDYIDKVIKKTKTRIVITGLWR